MTNKTIDAYLDADVALEVLSHEAILRMAYKDSEGVWTWSGGLTNASGHNVERYIDNPQTLEHTLAVFVWALRKYAQEVLDAFEGYELEKHEFAGALSFHWNTGAIGRATWVTYVKAGNRAKARERFMDWRKPAEILGRRKKELALFFDGKWSGDGTTLEYTKVTSRYTPVWASGKRVNVKPIIHKLLSTIEPPAPPVIDAVVIDTPVTEPQPSTPVVDYPIADEPKPEYSWLNSLWQSVKRWFANL